ncbi:hypothetical protein AB0368_14635 [Actinoplanes sp. NPDC051475]|uniref:hypothetical protein n=1 Tax=Actinoplanes sp. NPDC051475 TaxID=3157225 RepID=UPI00344D240D
MSGHGRRRIAGAVASLLVAAGLLWFLLNPEDVLGTLLPEAVDRVLALIDHLTGVNDVGR